MTSAMAMKSCIFEGSVFHSRLMPVKHKFRKRLFLMYLDLEELDRVFQDRLLWSTHRAALARFRRSDHFGDPNVPLIDAVRELVNVRGPVRVLTHLRYFGYVFNPLSLYFCYPDKQSCDPSEIVAEVRNTPWNETHCYVLGKKDFAPKSGSQTPKQFHVSPFMEMDMNYRWSITSPTDSLCVSLQNWRDEEKLFDVSMQLHRREISTASLAKMLVRYPFMTQQTIATIYWQAFRLWRKGVPYVPHPRKTADRDINDLYGAKNHDVRSTSNDEGTTTTVVQSD